MRRQGQSSRLRPATASGLLMRRLSRRSIGAPGEGLARIEREPQCSRPASGGRAERTDRQETTYSKNTDLLMQATDDELATIGWVGGAGWAGLIRALFLTLCSEPGYPPDNPSLALGRIEDMKEKYGKLSLYLASYSRYQEGACMFIETISAYVCLHCGAPGELRNARWVRAECDASWAKADEQSRASEKEWHEQSRAAWASRTKGFRGTKISW